MPANLTAHEYGLKFTKMLVLITFYSVVKNDMGDRIDWVDFECVATQSIKNY